MTNKLDVVGIGNAMVDAMIPSNKEEVEKNYTYVGKKFPEEARKIHYGEKEDKPIYGEATEKESKDFFNGGFEKQY